MRLFEREQNMQKLLDEIEADLKVRKLHPVLIYKLLDYWVKDLDIKNKVFLRAYLAYLLNARCSSASVVTRTIESVLGISSRLNMPLVNKNPTNRHDIMLIMKEFKVYVDKLCKVHPSQRKLYTFNEWNKE